MLIRFTWPPRILLSAFRNFIARGAGAILPMTHQITNFMNTSALARSTDWLPSWDGFALLAENAVIWIRGFQTR